MYTAKKKSAELFSKFILLGKKKFCFKKKLIKKQNFYLIVKTSHAMTSATLSKHVRYELAKGHPKSGYNLSHGLTRKKRRR